MSEPSVFMDGVACPFRAGQTLMEVAGQVGVRIPHLCYHPDFHPQGSCRLCTVEVDGRWLPACGTPAKAGMQVLSRTPALVALRRTLVEALLSQGNHFCPGCERSGDCRLQDAARALGVAATSYPQAASRLPLDASHPDAVLDPNRCILCGLCLRASREADGKDVFVISGRGSEARLLANAPSGRLGDTDLAAADRALSVCPVGALLKRGQGFRPSPRPGPEVEAVAVSRAVPPGVKREPRPRLATVSLAGCFGCHMSLLDMDEALLPLLGAVELTRSPLTDLREFGDWDIGLVEGGVCNEENLEMLRRFRQHSRVLVAVGACAINGGLPALRNGMDVQALVRQTYLNAPGLAGPRHLPADPELPSLLPRVYPVHEVVSVDVSIPGCPPSAAAIGQVLQALLNGQSPDLPGELIRYD